MTKSLLVFSAFCMTLLLGLLTYAKTPPDMQYLPTYPGAVQISDTTTADARFFTREWVFQTPAAVETVRTFYLDRLEHDRWQPGLVSRRSIRPLEYHWRGNFGPRYTLTVSFTTAADKTIIHAQLVKQPALDY